MNTPLVRCAWRSVFCLAAWLSMPASAATLRDALDQAWSQQDQVKSAREADYTARAKASRALIPEPPSLTLSHKTDRLNDNKGQREWEAELAAPLWLPGQQDRAMALNLAESNSWQQRFALERWKLAGELREALWAARLSSVEQELAARRLDEAGQLLADVKRRVEAGDLAPLALNQARALELQARSALSKADLALGRSRQHFASLAWQASLPDQDEPLADEGSVSLEQHPLLASLHAEAGAAEAKLKQAAGDTRDNPELALALSGVRDAAYEPLRNQVKLSFKFPFGTESRNQPRIAAANAELIETRLKQEQVRRQLKADLETARAELAQARQTLALANEQAGLMRESTDWMQKAFELGQLDLAAWIRARNENLDAELALVRARLEAARAISRFNQAAGVLP